MPVKAVRFVTAASLFDGHDAAINIIRRVLQSAGAEVVHLGHNRSVKEIVDTAIHEDAQGIAVSSYQGGHMEYFKYMVDLLRERGAGHINVYGGGGGVIVPEEIEELHTYGVARIFSPEDGLELGLRGMIDLMVRECDYDVSSMTLEDSAEKAQKVARGISQAETMNTGGDGARDQDYGIPTIGITGTGGAGKSTLTDELVRRFVTDFDGSGHRRAFSRSNPPFHGWRPPCRPYPDEQHLRRGGQTRLHAIARHATGQQGYEPGLTRCHHRL